MKTRRRGQRNHSRADGHRSRDCRRVNGPDLHAVSPTEASRCLSHYKATWLRSSVPISTPISPPSPATTMANATASEWLKDRAPADSGSARPPMKFSWQWGYTAFSIGPKTLDAVIASIDGQEAHHRTKTFQDEYRHYPPALRRRIRRALHLGLGGPMKSPAPQRRARKKSRGVPGPGVTM